MLSRIFPRQIDNSYRGHWLALWLFVPVVVLKAIQGVESILNPRNTAINADGIPLGSYGAAAAETVVAMFALLGFYLLLLPLQSAVVLVRWRALIPFMYLMMLIAQLGSRVLLTANPIVRASVPTMGFAGHSVGFYVNLAILAVTVIGFLLSLTDRSKSS